MQEMLLIWRAVRLVWMVSDLDWSLRNASEGFVVGLNKEAEFWRTNAIKPEIWEGDKSARWKEQQVYAVCTEVWETAVCLGTCTMLVMLAVMKPWGRWQLSFKSTGFKEGIFWEVHKNEELRAWTWIHVYKHPTPTNVLPEEHTQQESTKLGRTKP